MAIIYEKAVLEDLNIGKGTVSVTNPAGGTMTGTKLGLHSWNDVLNVKHNGCPGDGTECWAGFQDAIDKVEATGGVLYVPPGDYPISDVLTINTSGVMVTGGSAWYGTPVSKASTIRQLATDKDIIYITGASLVGISLRDLHLKGNIGGSSGHGIHVLPTSIANNLEFDNVAVTYAKGHGIYIESTGSSTRTFGVTMNRVRAFYCGGDGIRTLSTLQLHALDIWTGANVGNQISIMGTAVVPSTDIVMDRISVDQEITSSAYGMVIQGVAYSQFRNLWIETDRQLLLKGVEGVDVHITAGRDSGRYLAGCPGRVR
jgi:hypothetical protein